MENKTRKQKWTKKLKAIIISLSLAFVVALGGACAAIGISVAGRNQRWGGDLADNTAGSSDITPDREYGAGVTFDEVTYTTNADAWAAAVNYSVTEQKIVQFNLTRGWTATADTNGFATEAAKEINPDAFGVAGSLNVPEGATVILNINKHIKLDRNLASVDAIENGNVISVLGGRLIIQGDGIITGGNNKCEGGGGIIITNADNNTASGKAGGIVELYGGSISGNIAKTLNEGYGHAGGVMVSIGKLSVYGGAISNNTSEGNGAAIYVVTYGELEMTGGVIEKNSGNAGAVFISGKTTISGGVIKNNTMAGNGGGLAVYARTGGTISQGENCLTLSGTAEISNNTAQVGGGIYIGNNTTTNKILISGGSISNNTAANFAGGVYIHTSAELTMTDGKVSGNTSLNGGGGVDTDGKFIMTGGEISDNKSTNNNGGGVYVFSSASFEMSGDAVISGNTANAFGGGIYSEAAGEKDNNGIITTYGVTINGGKISDNTAGRSGGGVYASQSSLVMNGGEISGNTCSVDGGGLLFYGQNGTYTINDGVISGNVGNNGGGIMLGECTVTMNGGTVTQNTGNALGGGVRVYSNSTFNMKGGTVSDNVFKSNNSSYGGGGFFVDNKSTLNLTDATVTGNTSTQQAGGIYINDGCTLNATNSTISNNKSTLDGGGIKVANGVCAKLNLTGVTLSDNEGDWGGGIHYAAASATARGTINIHSSHINNNLAHREGGGIFTNAYVDINIGEAGKSTDVTEIANNTATFGAGIRCTQLNAYYANFHDNKDVRLPDYGGAGGAVRLGALQAKNGDVAQTSIFDHCTFANNSSQNSGGALSLEIYAGGASSFYQEVTINECTFTGNSAANGGGAIYSYINQVTVTNSTFSDNSALNGGAIYNTSPLIVRGSTLTGNSALNGGGGIYVAGASTLVGVTVTGNSAPLGGGVYAGATTTFGGVITVTDNTGVNENQKNNLTVGANNIIKSIETGAEIFSASSRIGINTNLANSTPGNGRLGVIMDTVNVNTVIYAQLNTIFTVDFSGQSVSKYQTNQTTAVIFVCDNNVTTTTNNATQWVNAATNSSDSNPITVTLQSNWTAATTSGSGATIETSFGTNETGKQGYRGGALHVPLGANIILNLGTRSINRGLSARTSNLSNGNVIIVDGTLTIVGTGSITGGACSGGGIFVGKSGKLIINGGTINSNKTFGDADGGGVYVDEGASLTMNGGIISGNNVVRHGGGVYVAKKATFTMNGGTIGGTNSESAHNGNIVGSTGHGAGVYNDGTFIMNGGTITGNEASNLNGGGVYVNASATFTMNGGKITNNYANDNGGGVATSHGTITITGGEISGNTCLLNGGDTLRYGGGIYAANGVLNITGGTITNNCASHGGGIALYGDSTLNLGEEKTVNNKTVYSGSAVIKNNRYSTTGGGILLKAYDDSQGVHRAPTLNFYGGTVSDNYPVANTDVTVEITPANGNIGGGLLILETCTFNMYGGTISGNKAYSGGGVYTEATLNMEGGTISGNTSEGGGGGGVYSHGTFTMSGGKISDNASVGGGGGGVVVNNNTFTMIGGTISNNTAGITNQGCEGGGVYVLAGTFIMGADNNGSYSGSGKIIDNTAIDSNGGGVCVDANSTFKLYGGEISGNKATESKKENKVIGRGGGVWAAGAIEMYGGIISDNTAAQWGGGVMHYVTFDMHGGTISYNSVETYRGGGVFTDNTGTLNMTGGSIVYNSARENGGGVALAANRIIISGTAVIAYNSTQGNGGGIQIGYNTSSTACILNVSGNAKIFGNTATSNGGGVYVLAGTFNMTGGSISDNTAETGGGVSIVKDAAFNMTDGMISGNTATGAEQSSGGGVRVYGKFVMEGGEISGNTSTWLGGGILFDGNDGHEFTISGGVIDNNHSRRGGGIMANATADGQMNITGGEIKNNTSEIGGAGIYIYDCTLIISDGTISGNITDSEQAGGIYINYNSTLKISGGTFSGNSTGGNGGGISAVSDSSILISGGVISDNYAEQVGGGVYVDGTFNMTGGTISGNSVNNAGGGVWVNSGTFKMSGGTIRDNSVVTGGGGVFVNTGSFEMSGTAVISNNTAGMNGGGVRIYPDTTFTMTGGTISGNEAAGFGGGVYVDGTFNMNGGVIGGDTKEDGNTAEQGGGGVFVNAPATVTMKNGTISNNTTAGNGGGVHIARGNSPAASATFVMEDGTISKNSATGNGGGVFDEGMFRMLDGILGGADEEAGNTSGGDGGAVYIGSNRNAEILGGTVSNNFAGGRAGGICAISSSVKLQNCSIINNSAKSYTGGVYSSAVIELLGGKIIITENTIDGVNANLSNNVSLNVVVTVSGALDASSRIGLNPYNSAGTMPVTVTSGYGSTMGLNAATLARNIFSADAEGVVAVYENNEIVLKQGVVLTVNDDNGNKIGSISTVNGAKVLGAFDEGTSVYTLTEENAAANNVAFASDVIPAGYAAYMYAYGDADKKEITEFTMGTTDATVCIGMKALERDYTIHYYLEGADGSYGSTPITVTHSGATGSAVVVVDGDGKPFGSIDEHYSLDNTKGDWQTATVEGDGSTEVNVYLKLAEYTVTYTAQGATPSRQTRKMKYGATVIAPARTPSKPMSKFVGWCDAGGNVINFATTTLRVTENMTLTAKFDMDTFHVNFNLNIDGEDADTSLPSNSEIVVPTASGMEDVDYIVAWEYERLFPDANGFNFRHNEDGYGVYIIDYTIDNIPNTMSIRNVKPTAVGYTFDGWYLNGQLVTTLQRPNVNTADTIELVAHWSPASYTMRYDKQDGSWNSVTSDTVTNMSHISDILPEEPTRAGYTFDGWYITPSADESINHTRIDANAYINPNDGESYFSIAKIAYLYELTDNEGNGLGEYDFSNLTLYAEWRSVDVYIVCDHVDNISLTFANGAGHNGSVGVTAQAMHVNDVVTVTPTANNGFRFTNLIVNGREQSAGVTEFTIRETYLTDYEHNGVTYKVVRVSANCSEERYRINYDVNGGTSTSSNFSRTYSPSELLPDSPSRAKLSSNLTKQGYDFMGWEFTSNHEPAFTVDAGVDTNSNLYGKNLWLATPTAADGVTTEYREVWLKAIWKAQPATVNLYNATYNNIYEGSPEDGYIIEEYGAAGEATNKLATAMKIEIINPERTAFNFLGWATSSNGAVVYPAVEGEDTIEYIVNADHDVNGNALNRNNLYAVWHIKGVDRIIMSVDNNNATYGGAGITMSAKTAQSYTDGSGETITLNYKWYRIFEGMYDNCFTVGSVYIENEKVTGYQFNGTYYAADGVTVVTAEPSGEPYEYKRFEESSVANGYCAEPVTRLCNPSETATLNVKNVGDCGIYVCVVEVVATSSSGSTTRAGGYGEIEIAMSKAVYGNLLVNDASVVYNSEAQWKALKLTRGDTNDGSSFSADEDEVVREITLPDGSRVLVTYKYFVADGNNRREVTSLSDIKKVGTYYAEVSFAFTPDGDKGNYELPGTIEAELQITPFEISNIGFTFVHGGDSTIEQNFSGAYDGTAYSVVAAINQMFDDGQYIAQKDDIQLVVQVNDVTENGDVAHVGETVSAGRYSLVITGKQGSDADNYVFKSGITLRKEYTIGKSVYDVSGKIKLEDKTFEFDNKSHKIEIEWEGEWPETVTPVYEITFEPEDGGFKDSSFDQNNKKIGNDGVNAGVYTVTVSFNDSASGNFEALESLTATMTITKTNVFEYMEKTYGEDLLEAAGFVGGSFAYSDGKSYLPTVNPDADCRLNNKTNFALSYKYYKVVDETSGEREELAEGERISDPGKYEIVALITYNSALYRNNFDEVQENESTITYVIRNFIVKNVSVVFADAFEAGGKVVNLGETFNYEWIKQIDVLHEDPETHVEDTRHIIREEDIALAAITLENDYPTFWHVGKFNVKVGLYGTDSQEYELTVKQEVTDFILKYRKDSAGAYAPIPDDGLELLTEGEYDFIIEYSCTDGRGATITNTTEAVVAEGGLILGENVLTATADYYTFSEITLDVYKVITEELTWQYSKDGGAHWSNIADDYPDYTLPYIGSEYLIRVEFTDGGVKQHCMARTALGVPVLNYTRNNYSMVVGRSGNYKVDAASYSIAVGQRKLEITWSDKGNGFIYNGMHQSPVVDTSNLAAVDRDRVTFGYQLQDTEGNALGQNDVIGAGTYAVKVVLNSDDLTYSENYTLVDTENAVYTFTIHKANIDMGEPTYSESNYGPKVTYANNAHGLRLNALQANFTQSVIDGKFAFVKAGTTAENYPDNIISGDDAEIKAKLTGSSNYAYIDYAYIPDDSDNYNVKVGQFRVEVKPQAYRTSGTDSLLIVLGADATPHYLIGQQFSTKGITVYRLYESYYTEGDKWFGFRGDAVANPNFRFSGNIPADGQSILPEYVSGGMLTLIASSGPLSGSIQIPVVDKAATKLEISSESPKTVFYVGETFDFSDMEFRATFEDGTYQDGLTKGSVKCVYDGEEFETAGTYTLVFSYFDVTCELEIEVKDKENLVIGELTTNDKTLIWTGEELTAPALKFIIDGDEYTTYDGITVTYIVRKGQSVVSLTDEGFYEIYYTITVTNPRFNKVTTYPPVTVEVTKNPYRVVFADIDRNDLTVKYTLDPIDIVKPELISVTDTRTDTEVVLGANDIEYYINGKRLLDGLNAYEWTQDHAGEFKVEVIVKIDGVQRGGVEYTFVIEQAENSITEVDVNSVVLGEGADFRFPVTAIFGANNAVYTYSKTGAAGTFTEALPDEAGTWYVMVTIPEEAEYGNYAECALTEALPFDVRNSSTNASVGEGSISGGNGIGEGWRLEIRQMDAEDVSQVSINRQNVLDGYEVLLKAGGTVIEGQGEYTVRVKLSEELSGRTDLKVFFKDANGNTSEKTAKVVDGYVEFTTSEFGTFIITSQVAGAPVGLLVAVIVLAVVAAGMITACVIVFVKKKRKGAQ